MNPRMPLRKGFSMKVNGVHLNLPDLQNIADELGITPRDVLTENGILTIYNTSAACQEIIEDNNLALFISMALDIPVENIGEITEVIEEPVKIEFNLADFEDDDD